MRVLVVDDDELLRESVALMLERELLDADVFQASSLAEAKRLLERVQMQVVVTDVAMQRSNDGWELAAFARAHGVAVVLVSGQHGAADEGKPLNVPLLRKSELARISLTDAVECAVASQHGVVERVPA